MLSEFQLQLPFQNIRNINNEALLDLFLLMQDDVQPRASGERIECVCGATDRRYGTHIPKARELWVQCDACEAWLHGACIGHPHRAPKGVRAFCKLLSSSLVILEMSCSPGRPARSRPDSVAKCLPQ